MSDSLIRVATLGACLAFVYLIGLIVYRIFLSPIANVPGPRLAALTYWYEFYYDIVCGGKYVFKIRELHEQYGPIIRVNPDEVHIGDATFHPEIYRPLSKGRTNKWDWAVGNLGKVQAGLSTVDHDLHRKRRSGYQSYFARSALLGMEPDLHGIIQKSMERLKECRSNRKAVNVEHIYAAVTCDFIHEYCFQSHLDICSSPDMGRSFHTASLTIAHNGPMLRHLPWMQDLMGLLPTSIRMKLNPDLAVMIDLKKSFVGIVQEVEAAHGTEQEKMLREGKKQTLIHHLLDADIPPAEKSTQRLRDEAQTMSLASTLTTGQTAAYAIYHILAHPKVKTRLLADIRAASKAAPDSEVLDLNTLESIPYLTATLYEVLRYTYGTTNRHPRIRPDETTVFKTDSKTYVLPPGVPVSMSNPTTNRDPKIWSDPNVFDPDRFMPLETTGQQMWKHVGSFGGGTRNCAGMNLAMVEMYLLIGETLRRFGDDIKIAPWVGGMEEMEIQRDYIIGRPNDLKAAVWIDWV